MLPGGGSPVESKSSKVEMGFKAKPRVSWSLEQSKGSCQVVFFLFKQLGEVEWVLEPLPPASKHSAFYQQKLSFRGRIAKAPPV